VAPHVAGMCGRYVSPETAEIERAWELRRRNPEPFPRRYNVAPTMPVQILRTARDSSRWELDEARWGLIPRWWSAPKLPARAFNARVEEAATKPLWRDAFAHMRCLVPALGWYEWRERQPYFIRRSDGRLACFAGLLSWRKEEGKEGFLTCAILTRDAAPSVRDIHGRMPVVLQDADLGRWIDRAARPDALAALLAGAQSAFVHHPVTARLNAARTDEAEFIAPLLQ
jgi:putative SOS response-associated peptidase YedK